MRIMIHYLPFLRVREVVFRVREHLVRGGADWNKFLWESCMVDLVGWIKALLIT